MSAGSASVLLVSGNHHHSNGSGDGHPQTEAISPILPRGTLDTWVTMAAPSSSSSTGGNNAASASASQLAAADSFVPADIFVSAAGEDRWPACFILFNFSMRPHISISGFVRPSVRPSLMK